MAKIQQSAGNTHLEAPCATFSQTDLKCIQSREVEFERLAKELKLGKGRLSCNLRLGEAEYTGDLTLHTGVGMRRQGGGNKLVLRCVYEEVAAWFNHERTLGHHIDRVDLLCEWTYHAEKLREALMSKHVQFEKADASSGLMLVSTEERNKLDAIQKCFDSIHRDAENRRSHMRHPSSILFCDL